MNYENYEFLRLRITNRASRLKEIESGGGKLICDFFSKWVKRFSFTKFDFCNEIHVKFTQNLQVSWKWNVLLVFYSYISSSILVSRFSFSMVLHFCLSWSSIDLMNFTSSILCIWRADLVKELGLVCLLHHRLRFSAGWMLGVLQFAGFYVVFLFLWCDQIVDFYDGFISFVCATDLGIVGLELSLWTL